MGVPSLLRCGAAPPPVLRMCSGVLPRAVSPMCGREEHRPTSAQIRTTLTHVHSHSARVFAYTLALVCTQTFSLVMTSELDVLHHRQHTMRRLTARVSGTQERKKP